MNLPFLAMALGGSYASGTDSFAAAINNNTNTYGAQGANAIAIGNLGRATGSSSITIGGINNSASAARSTALGSGAQEDMVGSQAI